MLIDQLNMLITLVAKLKAQAAEVELNAELEAENMVSITAQIWLIRVTSQIWWDTGRLVLKKKLFFLCWRVKWIRVWSAELDMVCFSPVGYGV